MNRYTYTWKVSNRMSLTVSVYAADVVAARKELEEALGKEVADLLRIDSGEWGVGGSGI